MNTSTLEITGLTAEKVTVNDESLIVEFSDGRVLSVPLAWYPRLLNGSRGERNHWRLIGRGTGIHWPELDEDVSVEGLVRGMKSGESQASLAKWVAGRSGIGTAGKGRSHQAPSRQYVPTSTSKGVRRVAEKAAGYGS